MRIPSVVIDAVTSSLFAVCSNDLELRINLRKGFALVYFVPGKERIWACIFSLSVESLASGVSGKSHNSDMCKTTSSNKLSYRNFKQKNVWILAVSNLFGSIVKKIFKLKSSLIQGKKDLREELYGYCSLHSIRQQGSGAIPATYLPFNYTIFTHLCYVTSVDQR